MSLLLRALRSLREKLRTKKRENAPKTPVDPRQIFRAAEVFNEAASLLNQLLNATQLRFAVPWGVNGAFALELYLKCLLRIECGQAPKGHNLKKLFLNLPRQTRDSLRREHDERIQREPGYVEQCNSIGIDPSLDAALEHGKDAYDQLRYAYEDNPQGVWGLVTFTGFVRKRILLLRPDFSPQTSQSL